MDIATFALIGFAAQIVDGALGMAFGIISSSALMAFGVPPAFASTAVHAAEVVTTGEQPRKTIGSVNMAEFLVTVAISATFFSQLDLAQYGRIVLGLIIGGALAAPLAGYLIRILPQRRSLQLVGVVVAVLCVVNVVALFS